MSREIYRREYSVGKQPVLFEVLIGSLPRRVFKASAMNSPQRGYELRPL